MNDKKTSTDFIKEIQLLENLYEFIIPKFREVHDIMVAMLDFKREEEIRIAELGCGFGELAERIFNFFPNAIIFGLDNKELILDRTKKRLQTYSDQFLPFKRDLNSKNCFNDLKPLHAIMSSFTLDYLPLARHKELVEEAFDNLEPGARWISCEFFKVPDSRINRVFHDIEVNIIQQAMSSGQVSKEQIDSLSNSSILRQIHHVCEIDEKIKWLQQAGFQSVQVPWRFLNIAIISAIR